MINRLVYELSIQYKAKRCAKNMLVVYLNGLSLNFAQFRNVIPIFQTFTGQFYSSFCLDYANNKDISTAVEWGWGKACI